MFHTLRSRSAGLAAGAAASALLVGGSLLGATSVQADSQNHPHKPYGVVKAGTLNERQYPSTDSSVVGQLHRHDRIGIKCKVRAQLIHGDPIWYHLRHKEAWVSGKYVHVHGYVKWCKDVDRHHHPLTNSRKARMAKG
ncbi:MULTISPECIES: SH3 domain-containing protein [Streptomyces]|uniref:SH3 domain-containing protein n=1 Tax=Streptomyces TaxID=1883 RepID=UPI001D155491|nr:MULTISPECIES: SH3 domain-containing protein [Streptomyces]MCC3650019.1 SH3 domain-containing protein [Streptomyces sp. S07_1.15]WSQ74953.1 SH3 domain-containing protein [Streptomyces xinghaiensis]